MSSRIEILWKTALKTFMGRESVAYKLCEKNFDKLHALMNNITAEDVSVTPEVLRTVQMQSAPMCVIEVFGNEDINIAIFILKHGVTMPIHDHPGMHGLLKVLSGVVKINSYTIQNGNDYIMNPEKVISATVETIERVGKEDPACFLTPSDRNLHEIVCIEGPAAFLDILSPPYNVNVLGAGLRPCNYFRVIPSDLISQSEKKSNEVRLIVADVPSDFYSKILQYCGPPLR